MATQHGPAHRTGLTKRLFLDHPRSLGMTWASHGLGALAIGIRLLAAGLACLVHAVVPGFFTQTAGRTITEIYGHMTERKAAAANPENWPDYEI
jgi:hypothetical protein